jgi:predicted esterase
VRRAGHLLAAAAFVLLGGASAQAQNAGQVRAAANSFRAQEQNLTLSEEQRAEASGLEREAQKETRAGQFGNALRTYAHAAAVLRNVEWTAGLELASSLEMRVNHVLLDPGKPVVLSLAPLFSTTQSADARLLASVYLTPADRPGERQLTPATPVEPARLPLAMRVEIPDTAPGNYALEVRLAPPGASVPQIVHDVFLKAVPVHIENLTGAASRLRGRLKQTAYGASPKHDAALAAAEYTLRFYEEVDRGEAGLRRFDRYPFAEQFASANAILDDLEGGRDPFAGKHGDFHRAYRSAVDRTLQPYRLFIPDAYNASGDFPLVVALHGSGGDENDFFDSYQESPMKPEAQRLGFLVVCPKGRNPTSGYRGAAEQDVFDVIAEVRRDYHVDPRRIYLMGHSMGAYATWRLAASHPDLFAALGPIAGGGDPDEMAKLSHMPQYVVHGVLDVAVPVAQSRAMVAAARKLGAPVVYVELPSAGHYDAVLGQFGRMFDFFARQARPASE